MNWLEITVETVSAGIDEAAAILTAGGFSELVLEDQADFEEFLDQNRACWDYIDESLQEKLRGLSRIRLYLEDTDKAGLDRLKELLEKMKKDHPNGELGSLSLRVKTLEQTDWEESWKENYPPVPLGDKLLMLPWWLADTDTEGRLPVILDPGLTFGTGSHPSTQMAIRFLEKAVKPGCSCLDLGSGSGILSIAALRLGAGSAVGVDIDPKAEDIARQNSSYNGFAAPEFTALTGNVLTDQALMDRLAQKAYDVVLVNIVADVIIGLAPVLPRFLGKDSTLILSGILDTRLQDVKNALTAAGLTAEEVLQDEDWRSIFAKRR